VDVLNSFKARYVPKEKDKEEENSLTILIENGKPEVVLVKKH